MRGLQGTAATTTIARGIHDAYKTWTGNGSNSNDNGSENKDKGTDKVKMWKINLN